MEIKTVAQLVIGETIHGFFLVKSAEIKTTRTNKKFLDLLLSDKTGEVTAKIWDYSEEDNPVLAGLAVKIEAEVRQWQEKPQLDIKKIRLLEERDPIQIEDLVSSAPFEPAEMIKTIYQYIDQIQDQEIQVLVIDIFEGKREKLIYYPAAKQNHHSIRSGLLYHMMTMLQAGEKLSEVYNFLNTDLLFAGIILHDICKVDEMAADELGIVTDYTKEGQLLGHLIQGVKLIDQQARKLAINEEKSLLLQHMILAHHNEPEYGSPRRPMFPEAEVLHCLDLLDAKMYDMRKAIQGIEEGQFSDRIWMLDNRRIYKHGSDFRC